MPMSLLQSQRACRRQRLVRHCNAMLLTVLCFGRPALAIEYASGEEFPGRSVMTAFGPVLATPEGLTLYWWSRDEATPGKSRCNDQHYEKFRFVTGQDVYLPKPDATASCEEKWPPFEVSGSAVAQGDWSIVTRDDGARQWAWRGRPLHRSVKDHKPGDVNAVSVRDRNYGGWQPAMAPLDFPPDIELLRQPEGLYMVTADGRLLVTADADKLPADGGSDLDPLVASELVDKVGEWSVQDGSGGIRQFEFRETPVFLAPPGELKDVFGSSRGWVPLVYRQAAPVPQQIHTGFSVIGDIYTDTDGMALYVFECAAGPDQVPCNDPGDPAAYWSVLCGTPEACRQRWLPYLAEPGVRSSGEWSVVSVPHPVFTEPTGLTYAADNTNAVVRVWAFRGRPVYRFADDDEPGQILGHKMLWTPASGFYAIQLPGNDETSMLAN